MFAVAVVAAAVEDDGRNTCPSDEVEDVVVPGGEGAERGVSPLLAELEALGDFGDDFRLQRPYCFGQRMGRPSLSAGYQISLSPRRSL